MATFNKDITDYFPSDRLPRVDKTLDQSPATTFLREVVDVCDAIHHCKRTFTRKKNSEFTKDSSDSFQRITTSGFALLMSHFETYQKAQYAEILNARFLFDLPDELELARRLEKEGCIVTLPRVLAAGEDSGETGRIIADALPGWHNPDRVNRYFHTLFPDLNLFSNDLVREFNVLWQLRHSIVHTGGAVSREDAIKVPSLRHYGERKLVFGEEFMPAIGRRFHIVIQIILDPLKQKAQQLFQVIDETDAEIVNIIDTIVGYSSRRKSWFR